MRIFKYMLSLDARQMHMIPEGACLLSVCVQNEMPVLYAMVDPNREPTPHIIRCVTTGEVFNAEWCSFIGTIEFGAPKWYMAHIFEQLEMGQSDPVGKRFADDREQVRQEMKSVCGCPENVGPDPDPDAPMYCETCHQRIRQELQNAR